MNKKMNKNKKRILAVILAIIIIAIIVFLVTRDKKEIKLYTIILQNGQQISTLKTDENGMLAEPENPIKEGYVFLGWYIGDEKVDFSKPFTGDTNIVARWGIIEEQPGVQEPQPEEPDTEIEEPETETPKYEEPEKEEPKPEKPEKEEPKPEEPEAEEPQPEEPKPVEVSSITLSTTTLNLEVGENGTLTATVNPSNATNSTVSWSSSDTSVATVDSNGKVKAVSAGTATITATADGKKSTCTVTVKNKVTYSIEWVKLDGTAIEQYKLYIKNSEGKYVSGTLELTTIAGATFEENVNSNGSANAYIKSTIQSVKIKNVI